MSSPGSSDDDGSVQEGRAAAVVAAAAANDVAEPSNVEDNEEPTLDSSFFPSPPVYYSSYTNEVVVDLPTELQPPNETWIRERGDYSVFGETWPVEEIPVGLKEMGVTELFNPDTDRISSLTILLQSLLITYTRLISSLTLPPPRPSNNPEEERSEAEKLVEHIRLICINMHFLLNQLRPVQAKETLKNMMRSQIELRRAKTLAIRQTCQRLTETLAASSSNLTTISATLSNRPSDGNEDEKSSFTVETSNRMIEDELIRT